MNFLAHIYLSGNDQQLLVGNFIGDSVKGNQVNEFIPPIAKGIRLHRFIDHYTDHHPVVLQSIQRLRPVLKKYAGVASDIFYDHFLATLWNDYSDENFSGYVDKTYQILTNHYEMMPARAQLMLPYMIEHNWLGNYAKMEGIDRTLFQMSKRTKFPSNLEKATKVLEDNYDEFKVEFQQFFPELKKAAAQKLEELDI